MKSAPRELMRYFSLLILLAFATPSSAEVGDALTQRLKDREAGVMVVAHRGCWERAPENSLRAIEDCIALGVDMVELDVRRTRDKTLVLMHDKTIKRTTNGSSRVASLSLKKLKTYKLRHGEGGPGAPVTNESVPTLRKALMVAKGRILVNLDIKGNLMKQSLHLVRELGLEDQVLIKSAAAADDRKLLEIMELRGQDKSYMPIISQGAGSLSERSSSYRNFHPVAYEVVFQDVEYLLEGISAIRDQGARLWVNTLRANLCAGKDEVNNSPADSWGWLIDAGVDMIQTDRPRQLLQYLGSR